MPVELAMESECLLSWIWVSGVLTKAEKLDVYMLHLVVDTLNSLILFGFHKTCASPKIAEFTVLYWTTFIQTDRKNHCLLCKPDLAPLMALAWSMP